MEEMVKEMEKKQISKREWASIKRVAQNVFPTLQKIEKLKKYVDEYNNLLAQVESETAYVQRITGRKNIKDIVVRSVSYYVDIDTGEIKIGKDGIPLKITKWIPNNDFVYYDVESNSYFITQDAVVDEEDNLL